jgi:undecaprenyl-diphosphatase
MDEFYASLILAIVQGLAEWFPISSSGHLVLFGEILNYKPGIMFDVALHFGTLVAVFVYFGKDIIDILEALLKREFNSERGKLGLLLLVGSIPAGVIGLVFHKLFESAFTSLVVVALGFGITGLVLFIASLDYGKPLRKDVSYFDAFLIGCAQAFAILPGVSRSGSTISAGILRGLDAKSAMRFSFLLSIPAIFGAGILEIGNNKLPHELIWATLVSFVVGLLTIHISLKFIAQSNKNLRWFGAYALILALIVLGMILI